MIERIQLKENDEVFGNTKIFEAFNYAPAVKANGFLFIAGQVGIDHAGNIPSDVESQIDLAFKRLQQLLEYEGLNFSNLVELVSYHVDIDQQLDKFRKIKDEYIGKQCPTWTIIGVQSLARDTLKIEIKATAAL